jgi:hypothetical protein
VIPIHWGIDSQLEKPLNVLKRVLAWGKNGNFSIDTSPPKNLQKPSVVLF